MLTTQGFKENTWPSEEKRNGGGIYPNSKKTNHELGESRDNSLKKYRKRNLEA